MVKLVYQDTQQRNQPSSVIKKQAEELLEKAGIEGVFYLCIFGRETDSPMFKLLPDGDRDFWYVLENKEPGYLYLFRRYGKKIAGLKLWPKATELTVAQMQTAVLAIEEVMTDNRETGKQKRQVRDEKLARHMSFGFTFFFALVRELAEGDRFTWKQGELTALCTRLLRKLKAEDVAASEVLKPVELVYTYFQQLPSGQWCIGDHVWRTAEEHLRLVSASPLEGANYVAIELATAVSTLIVKLHERKSADEQSIERQQRFADLWDRVQVRMSEHATGLEAEIAKLTADLEAKEALLVNIRARQQRVFCRSSEGLRLSYSLDEELEAIKQTLTLPQVMTLSGLYAFAMEIVQQKV